MSRKKRYLKKRESSQTRLKISERERSGAKKAKEVHERLRLSKGLKKGSYYAFHERPSTDAWDVSIG